MEATNTRGRWKEIVELGVTLEAAIGKALSQQTITLVDCAVLYLCYWQGYSDMEIARSLRNSPDSVWRARQRALKALRDTGVLLGYETV